MTSSWYSLVFRARRVDQHAVLAQHFLVQLMGAQQQVDGVFRGGVAGDDAGRGGDGHFRVEHEVDASQPRDRVEDAGDGLDLEIQRHRLAQRVDQARAQRGARGVLVLQFLAQRFRLPIARLFLQNALDPLLGLARSLLPHGGGFVQLRLQPQTALQLTLQLPRAHMIRHQRQQAAHFLQRGRVVAGLHLGPGRLQRFLRQYRALADHALAPFHIAGLLAQRGLRGAQLFFRAGGRLGAEHLLTGPGNAHPPSIKLSDTASSVGLQCFISSSPESRRRAADRCRFRRAVAAVSVNQSG